jgi:glycosyltransferase involved in cell wall biosynthesis/tetratricopeptide (TPR) repeat protein
MPKFGRKRGKPSIITLADQARDRGQRERAAGYYQEALRRNPQNSPIWVQYGHVLKESGDLIKAECAYRTALACDPRSADSHVQLGHVLKMQGKKDEARAAYLRAAALDPSLDGLALEFAYDGWSKAHFSELRGMLGARVNEPTTRLNNYPASPSHRFSKVNRSEPIYRRRRLSIPRFSFRSPRPSRITLADRARDAGNWGSAAQYYREALQRRPQNPPIWVQYGHVLKEAGKLREAEVAYRRAIDDDAAVSDFYLQLGHILKMRDKKDEAETAYLRAFTLDPLLDDAARELVGLGWDQARLAALRRTAAPKVSKHGRPGNITLADRARDTGKWKLAAHYYRRALDRNPQNAPIWVQYGHVLKEIGDFAQAGAAYREAIARDRGNADAHLHVGHFLKMQGRADEASPFFLRAVALDPSLNGALHEFSQLGWSEAHVSALKTMLQSDASDHPTASPERHTLDAVAAHSIIEDSGQQVFRCENQFEGNRDYADWVRLYDTIDDNDRRAIATAIEEMTDRPLISVVMPVFNTPEPYLRAAIDSVRQQLYPNWELCIADDASTAPHVRTVLEHYGAIDPRVRVCYRDENGHISVASNSALALATGRFIALLDHDDVLPEHALFMVAATLNSDPDVDLIYSDEDKLDDNGRFSPYFKSDWNPDLMLSQNMFSHLGVYRLSLIKKIGGFRQGYEGSQDYDLVLRAQHLTTPDRIRHIPHILYHWRVVPDQASVALGSEEKPYALGTARKAIADHLTECGITAEVLGSPCPSWHRVRYALPKPAPRVTVVIPTRDRGDLLRKCVEGLLHRTEYPDFEILIVDNQSQEQATKVYFNQLRDVPRVRILSYDAPFNYSAINNFAIAQATGSLICLLNNDTEVITRDWLTEMASHAVRPGIGAVGALLYYPDGRIQHGGVLVGLSGVAAHAHFRLPRGDFGYFGRAALIQNLSAVTAACLMVPKTVLDQVRGLNQKDLAIAYSDVDLCLRIREAGYRIVWTPHAELYHCESASRGPDTDHDKVDRFRAEASYMLGRWSHILDRDPYYNPNLRQDGSFDLAFPPRVEKPWRCGDLVKGIRPVRMDSEVMPGDHFQSVYTPARPRKSDGVINHIGFATSSVAASQGASDTRRDAALKTIENEFDPQFYLAKYPDVRAAGLDPLRHFEDYGWREGRDPSPHFSSAYYLTCNPDVRTSGINPLFHYVVSGQQEGRLAAPLLRGYRGYSTPYDTNDRNPVLRLPIQTGRDQYDRADTRTRLAVHIHVFYPNRLPQILNFMKAIPENFDLYISTDDQAKKTQILNMIENLEIKNRFEIRLCPNRGRDIAPFLILFRDVFGKYEYLLHLHTKKSIEKPEMGDRWMTHILENLLHDSRYVRSILNLLDQERRCGIIIPAPPDEIRFFMKWGQNYEIASRYLSTLDLDASILEVFPLFFPAGNMFWCRSVALERIFRTDRLSFMDFPPEPIPDDGTLAHALERLLPYVSQHDGFHYRVVEPLPADRMPNPRGDYLVTVVIPAYNAATWLHHSIQSMVLQQPAAPAAELILVDNGSNDETDEVCRFYSQTFSNIRYLKESIRGAGAARNLGIREAGGKYIYFLDADDMLALDGLECLLASATETDADLVTSQLCIFTESHIFPPIPRFVGGVVAMGQIVKGERTPRRDSPEAKNVEAIFGDFGPCAKLYKKDFLQKRHIEFPVRTNYEDNLFVYKAYLNADTIAVYPNPTYFYRRYVTHSGKTQSTVLSNRVIRDQISVLHQVLDLVEPTFSGFIIDLVCRKVLIKVAHLDMQNPIGEYLQENKKEVCRLFRRARFTSLIPQWTENQDIRDRLKKIANLVGSNLD